MNFINVTCFESLSVWTSAWRLTFFALLNCPRGGHDLSRLCASLDRLRGLRRINLSLIACGLYTMGTMSFISKVTLSFTTFLDDS